MAAEEALLAEDSKRVETMPPGTYDRQMGWITGRSTAFAGLKRNLAGENAKLDEPAERTAEDGAQLIEQLQKP
jgi:hypothetical protein